MPRTTNVGGAERVVSTVAGGMVLLYGLSKLSLSTIVAAVAGGGLLYRGLTGHCSAYQALDISTACGLGRSDRDDRQPHPRQGVTDASLAATGEAPATPMR
ncbi:MAG: DUF2892 domain-containing protein [Planctomycetales bacterium]